MQIRSEAYKAIRDRIKAVMPEMAFIDLQKGQFRNMLANYPIPMPACLVEFKQINWTNTAGAQQGDCVISLYYYENLVTDSFDSAEQENQTIELLDRLDATFEKMQGFSGEVFNPLSRIADSMEYGKRYVCFRTDFQTTVFHPKPNATQSIQKPNVKLKIKRNERK